MLIFLSHFIAPAQRKDLPPIPLPPLEVRNEDTLINEYTESDRIYLDGFVYLFLLGRDLPCNSRPLPAEFAKFLLLQSDNRFGCCYELLFAMFNQMQRHSAARVIANRFKNTSKSTQELLAMVSDANFLTRLRAAMADPT